MDPQNDPKYVETKAAVAVVMGVVMFCLCLHFNLFWFGILFSLFTAAIFYYGSNN